MKWWTWTLVFGAVAAAGCSSEPKAQGDDDDDDDDDDATTDSGLPTDSSFTSGPEPWEPVAVGFELDAILLADGTLGSYQIDGYGEFVPTMYLTFTSLAYFDEGITAEEQEEQSCIVAGEFAPSPMFPPDGIPLAVPAELFVSYDGALAAEFGHTCAGKVTPETWGADAANLLNPFFGAHVGIGFGRQTDYLRDAWSEESIKTYGDAMLAEYVALNDKNGTFEGLDWTTAMMFEWDPVTETLVADGEGLLVPMDVASLPSGSALPEGYVRSFSYWYQDFPLLDLSNLTDGAP